MVERKKQLQDSIREAIIKKFNDGKHAKKISEELEVNKNTVASVIRLFKKEGRITAITKRTSKSKKITPEACAFIEDCIQEDCSLTLKELGKKILYKYGIIASLTTISQSIKTMNYSFKRVVLVPEARNTTDMIEKRFTYCADYMLQDENALVFVDEFGISCSTRVMYGRSLIGTPATKNVRAIRSKNISICAAITKNGIVSFEVKDCAYNADRFAVFLEMMCMKLHDNGVTNGRIIMDNASIHKSDKHKLLLHDYGFELIFLPAYSPQLNPIKEVFSKWKHIIKARNSKTINELYDSINCAALEICSKDCNGFFSHVRCFVLKALQREPF